MDEEKTKKYLEAFIAINNILSKASKRFPIRIAVFRDDEKMLFSFHVLYKGGD